MTSYFVNEESERLFAFYEEWKKPQLLRFAQELGYKIQVAKAPCPQIAYFYSKKYHPQVVDDPTKSRDNFINVLQVYFIGKMLQPIFNRTSGVSYKCGIFEVCPVNYRSQTMMLYLDNTDIKSLFFVQTKDQRVYANIFRKENNEGELNTWIEFGGRIHEFYKLSPEVVQRIQNLESELRITTASYRNFTPSKQKEAVTWTEEGKRKRRKRLDYLKQAIDKMYIENGWPPIKKVDKTGEYVVSFRKPSTRSTHSSPDVKEKLISEMTPQEFREKATKLLMEKYGYSKEQAEAAVDSPY